ncbi:MAG: membrane protein insertase YidC [Clostridia bacterium]|nr:membrane protein insertase YidC [Clostridia bacterium]
MGILDIINIPFGYLFKYIYMLFQNYGWTIIIFTIVTKAVLLPLTIKQQKSMAKMQALQPKMQELQKKYQYDKDKLNQETMKLYQNAGVNPMGGCLPLLIQFPLLIALYNIIRCPLDYVIQLGKHGLPTISEVHGVLTSLGSTVAASDQIGIASEMNKYATELQAAFPNAHFLNINFTSFGLNFSAIPSISTFNWLLIIPVLAAVSTFLVSYLTNKMNKQPSSNQAEGAAGSMQMMNYIFPVMTFFFSITLPAGLGLYWTVSNIFQIVQQYAIKYVFPQAQPEVQAHKHFREREAEKAERRKK